MTTTPDDLVRREVIYCVSGIIHTLAQHDGASLDLSASDDLAQLTEQAFELSTPIDDFAEALIQEGYTQAEDGYWSHPEYGGFDVAAESICDFQNIEPYQREVFKHWIVSDWLADKLAEKGEKVDKDFAGMTVWARTTTGQAIAMDSVIVKICEDLNR